MQFAGDSPNWPIPSVPRTALSGRDPLRAVVASAQLWPELTPREREVLELYLNGMEPEPIARTLSIGLSTAKTYLQHIREKLGVHSQTALILEALCPGWRPSKQPGGGTTLRSPDGQPRRGSRHGKEQ